MKNTISLIFCIAILIVIGFACKSPSTDKTGSASRTEKIEDSPSGRKQIANKLRSAFAGFEDEVSIHTKGDNDEILYVGWAGLTSKDKYRADSTVEQFKNKVRGYGFKSIEFGDGVQTFWTYNL